MFQLCRHRQSPEGDLKRCVQVGLTELGAGPFQRFRPGHDQALRGVRHDDHMAVSTIPAPTRPLRPRDLFDERVQGDVVTVSMRATFMHIKTTKIGKPWAVIEG